LGILLSNEISAGAKFILRLAFSYIRSVTARHLSSGRLPNFAAWYKEWDYGTFTEGAPILGKAAITLGIRQHPSHIGVVASDIESYVCLTVNSDTETKGQTYMTF